MRAIWSGAIGFGLVNIPIKLFSATESAKLDLDMLDKSNNANIRYARINAETGEEVAWKDIVKGYKVGSDYVIVEDEDFKKVAPEKNDHLEIIQFINEKEIDEMIKKVDADGSGDINYSEFITTAVSFE